MNTGIRQRKVPFSDKLAWLCLAMVVAFRSTGAFAQDSGKLWAPLQFLAGSWKGIGSGEPGSGEGGFTFDFDLGSRIMVRKNWATYAPKPGQAEVRHEDLMIVYPEPADSRLHAVYFDNEGHVIRYVVLPGSRSNSVAFESDAMQPGPRYRLDYDLDDKGELTIAFSIAPPGQPFKTYTKGTARKIQQVPSVG
jgi:hypothetical protein